MKDKTVDMTKFEEWLTKHWKGQTTCPICNSNSWNISEKLFTLREFRSVGFGRGEVDVYPLVAVACNVCGYTHLFNAIVVGLAETK